MQTENLRQLFLCENSLFFQKSLRGVTATFFLFYVFFYLILFFSVTELGSNMFFLNTSENYRRANIYECTRPKIGPVFKQ